jgi:predicted SpoU family rRNA methylase
VQKTEKKIFDKMGGEIAGKNGGKKFDKFRENGGEKYLTNFGGNLQNVVSKTFWCKQQ